MKNSPRLASLDVPTSTIDLSPDIDAYPARLTREQNHFLRAIADAGAMIPADSAHLGHVAAIQGRLTQEFLDAQRAILRRRAETHAIVSEIATSAEAECAHLIAEPIVATPYVTATSAAPTRNAITTDDGDLASIALLVADTSSQLRPTLPPVSTGSFEIRLPAADADALNDQSAAPSEELDRFWGSLAARGSGGRGWVSAQILLPCVAVFAVLALFLAVVG